MEVRALPEGFRRVRSLYWPMGRPLGKVTPDELQAARELIAESDPWTRLFYATRHRELFGDLEPHPHPPVLRD